MIYIKKERDMPTQMDDAPPGAAVRKQPRHNVLRFVDLALGFANAAVLGLSVALTSGAFQSIPLSPQETEGIEERTDNSLLSTLRSDEFTDFQREYAQEQIEAELADAERLKAEAEGLKVQAAADANKTKDAAEQSAEAIRLEASYKGVAQRYHRPEGFVIRLNYPATVEKEQTEFGYTATARPTTAQGTVRVYVNLASVTEGFVPAGSSIGTVGQYPVGEGVKAF